MAAYATALDVSGLMPQVGYFSATTKPTDYQVNDHCADVSREVDALLASLGYATPIVESTSPIAFARVKTMVMWAGAAFALATRTLGVANPGEYGADWARKEYERRLAALRSPEAGDVLTDAVRTSDAPERDDVDLIGGSGMADAYAGADPSLTRSQVF